MRNKSAKVQNPQHMCESYGIIPLPSHLSMRVICRKNGQPYIWPSKGALDLRNAWVLEKTPQIF